MTTRTSARLYFKCGECGGVWDGNVPARWTSQRRLKIWARTLNHATTDSLAFQERGSLVYRDRSISPSVVPASGEPFSAAMKSSKSTQQ